MLCIAKRSNDVGRTMNSACYGNTQDVAKKVRLVKNKRDTKLLFLVKSSIKLSNVSHVAFNTHKSMCFCSGLLKNTKQTQNTYIVNTQLRQEI